MGSSVSLNKSSKINKNITKVCVNCNDKSFEYIGRNNYETKKLYYVLLNKSFETPCKNTYLTSIELNNCKNINSTNIDESNNKTQFSTYKKIFF